MRRVGGEAESGDQSGIYRFLNDLIVQGKEDEALAHVPRDKAGGNGGRSVYHRTASGLFCLGPDPQGFVWTTGMPAMQLPVRSAMAYAAWLSAQTGQEWRLPVELEWEKLARGVDGRIYPWPTKFEPGLCHHRGAIPDSFGPSEVGQFPRDQSVYGIQGVSGNVMEWCGSPYPALSCGPGEVVPDVVELHSGRQATRGGSWIHQRFFCQISLRRSQPASVIMGTIGFRVVRSV